VKPKSGQPGRDHPDPLAPLLRLFEKAGRGWWSTSINFRRADRLVVVEGVRWTVHFNVHGVRMGGRRARKVELTSAITLWPVRLSKQQDARLVKSGWYRDYRRQLRQRGYRGDWQDTPHGKAGFFRKKLRDVRAVRAETDDIDQRL
jgi:hypothetical protein